MLTTDERARFEELPEVHAFTQLRHQLACVLATLSDREAGVTGCASDSGTADRVLSMRSGRSTASLASDPAKSRPRQWPSCVPHLAPSACPAASSTAHASRSRRTRPNVRHRASSKTTDCLGECAHDQQPECGGSLTSQLEHDLLRRLAQRPQRASRSSPRQAHHHGPPTPLRPDIRQEGPGLPTTIGPGRRIQLVRSQLRQTGRSSLLKEMLSDINNGLSANNARGVAFYRRPGLARPYPSVP